MNPKHLKLVCLAVFAATLIATLGLPRRSASADPVSPPYEVQALPGNKFTTRILTHGVYYLRVDANHAFYQLRTSLYDPPPYPDPRLAPSAAGWIIWRARATVGTPTRRVMAALSIAFPIRIKRRSFASPATPRISRRAAC
jgi:hypothetical protein